MKKKLLLLIMAFCCVGLVSAKELTSKQRQLRTEIVSFLKTEGYMPEIDSDGDVKFKSEGKTYYIIIDETESDPMYLSINIMFEYSDSGRYSRSGMERILPDFSRRKAVKVELYDNTICLCASYFLTSAEQFKTTFYRTMRALRSLYDDI